MPWFRRRQVSDDGINYETAAPSGRRGRLVEPVLTDADRSAWRDDGRTYPRERTVIVERRGGFFRTIGILLLVAALVVAVLIATGFWRADIRPGALPKVEVSGGALPAVDVDARDVVVGTQKREIEVPTIGISNNRDEAGDRR